MLFKTLELHQSGIFNLPTIPSTVLQNMFIHEVSLSVSMIITLY